MERILNLYYNGLMNTAVSEFLSSEDTIKADVLKYFWSKNISAFYFFLEC